MKDIIEYLLKIEKTAGDIYRDASVFFRQDKEFARFLSLLAEDEADHFDAVFDATRGSVDNTGTEPAFIRLDADTIEKFERPFVEVREKLLSGDLTREAMIEFIVTVEFSEWNDIFLYFVNTLRDSSWDFQRLAAMVQRHKKRIEAFLEPLPDCQEHLEKIRRLPGVWQQKILIVEDDPAIAAFLSVLLEREGIVETAEDGEEGLRKTGEQYFDIIVSDVNMSPMSGIEFYREAVLQDNSIGERFLFFTGRPSPENVAFFETHNVRYMTKPADLSEINMAVRDVMYGTS